MTTKPVAHYRCECCNRIVRRRDRSQTSLYSLCLRSSSIVWLYREPLEHTALLFPLPMLPRGRHGSQISRSQKRGKR